MRHEFLVSYDISDAKRLRKVFKTMRGFGNPVQYSVFFCTLSKAECLILQTKLLDIINVTEDRVMVVNIGLGSNAIEKSVKFLGKSVDFQEQKPVVI